MNTIRTLIVGTGKMAAQMVGAMQTVGALTPYAVVSRDAKTAGRFARTHRLTKAYDSLKEALLDPAITLVYIATPHPFHAEAAKAALLADKHVLCEKPLTLNSRDSEELLTLARHRGLFFSEALWTRFLPAVTLVQQQLQSGVIGRIHEVKGSIGFDMRDVPRMTNATLGGGMLLDCGIYLLTSLVLLCGEDITDIRTNALLSDQGIDLHSETVLRFANGTTAFLTMAMDAPLDNTITVYGDKGTLTIHMPYHWQDITIQTANGTKAIALPSQIAGGYEYMIEAVANAIHNNRLYCDETAPHKTLFIAKLMDTLRDAWSMRYPNE